VKYPRIEKSWSSRCRDDTSGLSLKESYRLTIDILECEPRSEIAIYEILHDRRYISPPHRSDEYKFICPEDFLLESLSRRVFPHFFAIFISEVVLSEVSLVEIEDLDGISAFF
jgi:hypothetical protein